LQDEVSSPSKTNKNKTKKNSDEDEDSESSGSTKKSKPNGSTKGSSKNSQDNDLRTKITQMLAEALGMKLEGIHFTPYILHISTTYTSTTTPLPHTLQLSQS
jgi:hypothetical protein